MSDEERPKGGGIFSGLANAMIERSLPAIREWLKSRLGPRARIGQVELDGNHLRVRDALLPIGARIMVHVDEARLLTEPDKFVSGLPPVRLEELRGRLRAEHGGVEVLDAAIRFEAAPGTLGGEWVDGRLHLEDGRWAHARGVGEPAPMAGAATLRVGPRSWSVADGELESGDSLVTVEGHGAVGAGARLARLAMTFTRARAGHLLDALEAFSGQALSGLPAGLAGATIDGGLGRTGEATRLDVTFSRPAPDDGEASALHLVLDLDGDDARKIEVSGLARVDELWPAAWPAQVDAAASAPLRVDARGSGRLRELRGAATVTCERLAHAALREPAALSALLEVGADAARLQLTLGTAIALDVGSPIDADGQLDGAGTLHLLPAALTALGQPFAGPPIAAALRLRGKRTAPRLGVSARSKELSLGPLALGRTRLTAELGGGSTLELDARCGPGQVRVRHRPEHTELRAARIESAAAVALAELVFARRWVGDAGEDSAPLRWPRDAQLWVDLVRDGELTRGQVHVETPRSRASIAPLVLHRREGLDGTLVRGLLDADEAAEIGLLAGPLRLASGSRVAVEARMRGPRGAPVLDAELRSDAAGLHVGGARALPLREASARVVLTRDALELVSLDAQLFGGVLRVRHARRPFGGSLSVQELLVAGLSEGLGPHLTGGRALADLALDARLSGRSGRLEGQAHLRTARSSITADLMLRSGVPEHGTTLAGHVDGADLRTWTGPFALGGAPVSFDARVLGDVGVPQLAIEARGENLVLVAGSASVRVDRAKVSARVGRSYGLLWDGLELDLLGGSVRSRGASAPGFHLAEIAARDLRIGDVELAEGPLARLLSGTLSGAVRVFGRRRVGVLANAMLEAPRFAGLRQLSPQLARLGLPLPRLEGDRPVTARVRGRVGEGLVIEQLSLGVPELSAEARARVDASGALEGRLIAWARGSWLERSPKLQLAAKLLGDVELPFALGGHLGAPTIELELGAAIDRAFGETALGRAFVDLFGRADAATPPIRSEPDPELALLGVDALLERAAAGGEDADDALGALMERGLTPADILTRVAAKMRALE